jgi:hypothetical protein
LIQEANHDGPGTNVMAVRDEVYDITYRVCKLIRSN